MLRHGAGHKKGRGLILPTARHQLWGGVVTPFSLYRAGRISGYSVEKVRAVETLSPYGFIPANAAVAPVMSAVTFWLKVRIILPASSRLKSVSVFHLLAKVAISWSCHAAILSVRQRHGQGREFLKGFSTGRGYQFFLGSLALLLIAKRPARLACLTLLLLARSVRSAIQRQ
ncbi:MAG: hypothetical protein IMX00_01160 [Limnochordales bacterium]|nr:hypothetical protein [Limnochordales bacterium]